MGGLRWLGDNWFILLQSAGIIGGLMFTAVALRADTRAKRINTLITLTHHHRQLWAELLSRPDLGRLIDPRTVGNATVTTRQEELFITLLTLHLKNAHQAIREDLLAAPEGLAKDIRWFFSLPLPRAVWEKVKPFHDETFVAFVEACRADG